MWKYILLGILQGIFEWLPISSEGIVALTSRFLVININPIDVALFLHFGTLFAVLIYFWKDWKDILTLRNLELFRFLLIATLVSLLIGYPIYNGIKDITVVGDSLLILMGFGLLLTAYFHKTKKKIKIDDDKLAVVSGFLQGLAVIPGVSRSGATIFGLSLGKNSPKEILKISYMISVPVILASSFYLFLNNQTIIVEGWFSLIASFLVGFLTLKFLMNIAKKINFFKFALIFALLCFLGAAL